MTGESARAYTRRVRAVLSQLCLTVGLVGLVGSCSDRVAEIPLDLEAIKLDACERNCETLETCNIDLSWSYEIWPEPQGCVERCMTLLPHLHELNQCGSREIIGLRCVGDLDCEGYAAYQEGWPSPTEAPDWSAPCMVETAAGCSIYEPFDLDEDIPAPDWP